MIKVTVDKKDDESEIKYPLLMQHYKNKNIVLFSEDERGMLITEGIIVDSKAGHISNDWDMDRFKPFKGSITLENE